MKLKSLEAFCSAVEERSISAAARRMYLSQPSVSERLAELEREAGVPLLRRSRLGVEATVEGATFYERASKLLREVQALEQTLHTLRDKDDTKLRFAACVTVGERAMPEYLWQFKKKKMSEVAPMLITGNDLEVLGAVRSGQAPLGILAGDECFDYFEDCTPIIEDELIIAVAPAHPWARRQITPADLSTEPYISREEGSKIKALIEDTLADMDVTKLDVQMEVGSTTAIKEVVEEGWAFSVFSRADIQRKLDSGTLVEVKGFSIPWSFKLVRNSAIDLTLAEQRFYEFLLEKRRKGDFALRDQALESHA
ncbi:MAG: LysR family transcriptional regulator [Rubrobacteraceae bacterium]